MPPTAEALRGGWLWLAAIVLAAANFVAVLDTTIANVSVPTIAGSLAATSSQGTWVITSYAVAEAITVPLTGWLAARFGAVRVFAAAMGLFAVFSALCGLADSLPLLVAARVFQGLAGGPLMPLSQTLLLRIFPPEKAAAAVAIWSMTTVTAPVLGPILGGWICDEHSWPWIFYINLPLAGGCAALAWKLLARYEQPRHRTPMDWTGLGLLVVWVGALQVMLDEGKNLDWFASPLIVALAVVAAIGLAAFLIWELTDAHPIVDLRVFRHRGFSASVLTVSLAFAAFFGVNVLTPLWLQSYLGYTAGDAGLATAGSGMVAVFVAPLAAGLAARVDARRLVFGGVLWLGIVTAWRCTATSAIDYGQVALPLMAMGLGLPFFFVAANGLALASVGRDETASAAGLLNFLRTLAGAFATSLITTAWEERSRAGHALLVERLADDWPAVLGDDAGGLAEGQAAAIVERLLSEQGVMLATNEIMLASAFAFAVAALSIWLAPPPARPVDPAAAGH